MRARFKLILDGELDVPGDTLEEALSNAREMHINDILPRRGRKLDLIEWNVSVIGVTDEAELP